MSKEARYQTWLESPPDNRSDVSDLLRRYRKYLRYVSIVTGALLIFIGVLLLTDSMDLFTRLFPVAQIQIWIDSQIVALWGSLTGSGATK